MVSRARLRSANRRRRRGILDARSGSGLAGSPRPRAVARAARRSGARQGDHLYLPPLQGRRALAVGPAEPGRQKNRPDADRTRAGAQSRGQASRCDPAGQSANQRLFPGVTMPENFLYDQAAAVATITFNRPERRNCMTREVMLEFEQLVHRVRDTPEIRVLIVTGTGTAFSAGANVAGAKGITDPRDRARIFAADNKGLPRIIGRIFDTVLRLDALTIGAVNGYAVGGGWALAAAMDFVIAA